MKSSEQSRSVTRLEKRLELPILRLNFPLVINGAINMNRHVFVSHADPDKRRIAPLIGALLDHDIPLWIDRPEEISDDERFLKCSRIRPGPDWRQEIEDALRNAACVLFLLSKESN